MSKLSFGLKSLSLHLLIGGRILSFDGVSAKEFCLEIIGDGLSVFEGCNVVCLATNFDFL